MSDTRTAIVTGGTRGIGRAVSMALARSGCTVYALYVRNHGAAQALRQEASDGGFRIHCIQADLTDDGHLRRAVDLINSETDCIDLLVHAAASGVHRPALELTAKHLLWTFDVNVVGIHRLIRAVAPTMHRGGAIVGLTSSGGSHALSCYAAVGASKGALEALFRHYAQELAPRGIAVNLVCPGIVLTEALDAFPDRDRRIDSALSMTPSGRLTTPEDVAAAVLFACSEGARQIIGQTIVVDGGRRLT